MAVMATELNIKGESSFVPSQYIMPLFSEKIIRKILHDFGKAQLLSQTDLSATLLHNFACIPYTSHLTEEIETRVSEIDYRNFYILSDVVSLPMRDYTQTGTWLKKEIKEIEQESFLAIVSKLSQLEKVQSVYVQRYREELQIQILLSITQYDDDLMDSLLDIEYDIRKRYPEIVFEFFYPPAGISEKKDFVHPRACCIYSR